MSAVKVASSSIKTVNPATNKIEKQFEVMSDEQIETLLANADHAFSEWKNTPFTQRAALLHKVAAIMREQKETLGKLCTIEMGKRLVEGIGEVELCANIFDYYADHGTAFWRINH